MPPIVYMLLPIIIPLIAVPLSTFLLGEASGGFSWLRAHAKTKSQQAAIDLVTPLVLGQLQQVVKIAASDLTSDAGRTKLVGDVINNIKQSAPQAVAAAKKLLGLGVDSLDWWIAALVHQIIKDPAPMTKTPVAVSSAFAKAVAASTSEAALDAAFTGGISAK